MFPPLSLCLVLFGFLAGCKFGTTAPTEKAPDTTMQAASQYELIEEVAAPSATELLPAGTASQVELRVLLISIGDKQVDSARGLMEPLLTELGVPYDVLDASKDDLTAEQLRNGERGRYNGVIMTHAETLLADGTTGLDTEEFATLFAYEREYGVRQAVLSGFPISDERFGIDYGMGDVEQRKSITGQWVSGDRGLFSYVNQTHKIPIPGNSFVANPRASGPGPVVTPLLVDAEDPEAALISHIQYADGREVLLSSMIQGDWLLHSQLLAYEFLSFATGGLFLGSRRAHLVIHNDDMFFADRLWDSKKNRNFEDDDLVYRLTAEELELVVDAQQRFHEEHPLASEVVTHIAYNAILASDDDPLTQALVEYGSEFGFINHTFEARQLDRECGLDGPAGCPRTSYAMIFDEIEKNAVAWEHYGFPGSEFARYAMLPDSHSGLMDRNGTPEPDDDVPFPWGFNPALGEAAEAVGIRVIAGDHSRLNQSVIRRIPDFDLVLLPRYPTSVYFNVIDPEQMTDEYNYIHHERYLEQGEDPCELPAAICERRSYEQILAAEADLAFRHILSGSPFPHYFHQSNLHTYDDAGHILQFDWQEAVLKVYERWCTLPIASPYFNELADIALRTVARRESGAAGYVDRETNEVVLVARKAAKVEVTGIAGGILYGGQSQRLVELTSEPQSFPLAADLPASDAMAMSAP